MNVSYIVGTTKRFIGTNKKDGRTNENTQLKKSLMTGVQVDPGGRVPDFGNDFYDPFVTTFIFFHSPFI